MRFFKHDVSSRNDDKIFELIEVHGMQGYGIWWVILEELYSAEENGFRINTTETWFKRLSKQLNLTDWRTLIRTLDTMAECGLIDSQLWAEHVIFAPGITRRADEYMRKKELEAEKKRRQREKSKNSVPTLSPGTNEGQPTMSPGTYRDIAIVPLSDPDLRDQNSESISSSVAGAINAREETAPAAAQPMRMNQPTLSVKVDKFFGQTRQPVYLYQQQRWDANAPWKSDEERKEFQAWLTELVRSRGKQDPVRYAERIICDVANGKPCSYWDDFKTGKTPIAQARPISLDDKIDWENQPCFQDWLEAYQQDGQYWLRDANGGLDQAKCNFANYVEAHGYAS